MAYLGVPEMREFLSVHSSRDKNDAQKDIEWVKANPVKATHLLWYFVAHMEDLIARSDEKEFIQVRSEP